MQMASDEDVDGSVLMARELVARYEYQLLHGCQHADCTEPLCLTGCSNVSDRAVRKYTTRSAKTVAMALCAGPRPRLHLCRYCVPSPSDLAPPRPASSSPSDLRDPSSLSQLLSDTQAVQSFHISGSASDMLELASKHRLLDQLLTPSSRNPWSSRDLPNALASCLDWLLNLLPNQRPAIWEMLNCEIISKGSAVPSTVESKPSDSKWNAWVEVLDILDNPAYLRLWERALRVVGGRMSSGPPPENAAGGRTCGDGGDHGAIDMLISHVSGRGNDQSHIPLATIVWLKRLFATVWDGNPVLDRGSVAHVILELLQSWKHLGTITSRDAFQMPLIRLRLADMDLASSWYMWNSASDDTKKKHILNFQYLFSSETITTCFRAVNLRRMSRASGSAIKSGEYRHRHNLDRNSDTDQLPPQLQHQEEHYMLLYVSRSNLLKDTFDQLWQRRKSELRRPLRVRMGADELDIGHDLGGVQVEFFNIVCKHIFSEEAQMFTTDPQTGLSYFTAGSLQPLYMFELFGLLLALAIYNGITLPVRLPGVLYHVLCDVELPQPLAMIEDAWPTLARSLRSLLSEFVEDLEYAFPLEANGLRLSCLHVENRHALLTGGRSELCIHTASPSSSACGAMPDITDMEHAWPGWKLTMSTSAAEPPAVTPEHVEDYINAYSQWLCFDSVLPQLEAFIHGFRSSALIDSQTLSLLGPSHLQAYVEGMDMLNIHDLKAAVRYDGYVPTQKYILAFWRVVASWPPEKQKLLLKFVTATERIPISGASSLTFIIKRAYPETLQALPTSSTCFGTLMLPRYPSTEIMAEKLSLALKFGAEGFGAG
ncbi:putative E3 ubiquitin-protein ligase [Sphaerulina musiva]